MKMPRILLMVGCLIVLACGIVWRIRLIEPIRESAPRNASSTDGPQVNELEILANGDPLLGASKAIASNDFRLIGFSGTYVPKIPGLTEEQRLQNTNEVRWVNCTDRPTTRIYYRALQYAESFNQRIIAHLASSQTSGGRANSR